MLDAAAAPPSADGGRGEEDLGQQLLHKCLLCWAVLTEGKEEKATAPPGVPRLLSTYKTILDLGCEGGVFQSFQ